MTTQVTVIVPSSVEMMIYGVSRIEISARKIKMWGLDVFARKPDFVCKRGAIKGTESFYQLCEYVRANTATE